MTRRTALVLSYYFPPAGGPGVQRVMKLVKHLPAEGWEPVVVTVDPARGAYPKRDPSLEAEVPETVEVVRTGALDPFGAYARLTGRSRQASVKTGTLGAAETWQERLAQGLRANLFLPDARVGWVPFALKAAARVIRARAGTPGAVQTLLTSGPPHSTHLGGLRLQRRFGLPWVADFRDPWTDINYYGELPMTGPARRLDAALERRVLQRADRIVTVSPASARLLASKAGLDPAAIAVIPNGFDQTDFEGPASAPSRDTFVIAHVGSLYGLRDPATLWAALKRLRREGAIPKLRVRLVGRVDEAVEASLKRHGVDDVVDREAYLPHEEAVRAMREAHVLLLAIDRSEAEATTVTGKVYEYLGAGRPVLGAGPVGGDADLLLREAGAGALVPRGDVDALADRIRTLYTAWAEGQPLQGASPQAAAAYTRQAQAGQFAGVLDRAAGPNG